MGWNLVRIYYIIIEVYLNISNFTLCFFHSYLQNLFYPDTSNSSNSNTICLLSSCSYYNHLFNIHIDAGYYKVPYLHIRVGGTTIENHVANSSTIISNGSSVRGLLLMQYIACVFSMSSSKF